MVIVVMGVSGVGKTTVGKALADAIDAGAVGFSTCTPCVAGT